MNKEDIIQWLEANREQFIRIADEIWANPEIAYQEVFASKRQADFLKSQGFRITDSIGGMKTSFIAEYGTGQPVLGFIGEYDALSGLSQKKHPVKEAACDGGPGHGCGHNLLGTGCMASAVVLKKWLESKGSNGTVRYYGCPAEERLSGKTFMARAGVFDDLDAALNFHPSRINSASKGNLVGLGDLTFRFHGRAAHAAANPHSGRSALDAVELMNVGSNYLREHVRDKVRIHYVITHGGDAPNIVPPEAEVWYFIRAHKREELFNVMDRVRDIAKGAALMTGTTVSEVFNGACSSLLNNHYLADLQYEAMKMVGPIEFTQDEKTFAQTINSTYPRENAEMLFSNMKLPEEFERRLPELRQYPLIGENFPPSDADYIGSGSTDLGDVSWITPLSMVETACLSTASFVHDWGAVATCGMSIGHKGMMHGAKILALTAIELLENPHHLEAIRKEFETATNGERYVTPLPEDVNPPETDDIA